MLRYTNISNALKKGMQRTFQNRHNYGGAMQDRNQEGYRDPTASQAVRRAERRREGKLKRPRLTYSLREADGFQEAAEAVETFR